jgi:sensor c-di-GMP phosphodiesterase-like protein
MAGRLRTAVQRRELVVHYQPIVDLRTGDIVSAEALLRWRVGESLVMPDEFIPLAERTGLIRPITDWIINEVAQTIARWQSYGATTAVSINVHPSLLGRRAA